MRIACVAFTHEGLLLAHRIALAFEDQGDATTVHAPARLATSFANPFESLQDWANHAWKNADALLFVGACGIAVRTIAPFVANKYRDPAVVCVDELGNFAISLLSGHVGGANQLARRVGALVGGQPVVTTATDVHNTFAVDEWAASRGLAILDRDVAKEVSVALLEGRSVGFVADGDYCDCLPTLPKGIEADDEGYHDIGICISRDTVQHPFARTLRLVPRTVTVGVGCKRKTDERTIARLVDSCLAQAHVAPEAVRTLASIDVKADEAGLLDLAGHRGWEAHFYSAEQLRDVPGSFDSSDFVQRTVGVDNVCERAACAEGATLILSKQAADGVTVALASHDAKVTNGRPSTCLKQTTIGGDSPSDNPKTLLPQGETRSTVVFGRSDKKAVPQLASTLWCVGLGPGARADLTARARQALQDAELIVGYTTYVDLVRKDYPQAEFVATPMRTEVERCQMALEQSTAGRRVALVCSGDPGIYGMAGLLLELAKDYPTVRVEVVPGVTAANGGAALLGAPLMHDWCSISLSDLMTPWSTIQRRLETAAKSDLCICLYNPASRGRANHLRRACDILLQHLDPSTICGIARNVGREGQESRTLTLAELREAQVDMLCCVFVGNSQTKLVHGRMVTPRGYLQREA